ncbi:MAG: trimethylamine methyltransferase family protein, partial [Anaerolineae bacterium]|nr:trimethylamine methyltransferase family protein [Anaerolineae bacterium]
EATLRILDETGIVLDHPGARSLLLDHGAREDGGRVCLPAELVKRCVALCPPTVTLQGRGGNATLGDGALHVHNLGGARDVLDGPGGETRPAMSADVAASACLLDALPNATTVTPMYTPQDVSAEAMTLVMFAETVRNTTKPINGPGVQTADEARLLFEMLQIVFGDRPQVSVGVSPVSPLTFPADNTGAILEVARLGLPFGPLPCPQVGATAPMTLAGALALQNAENLAAIVLAQLVRPGLPIIYCGRLAVMDMRTIAPLWGNPETGLISAATVQLGHRYGLPVNVYGLCTTAYDLDMQNGYERAINAALPALAGADEISGIGEMGGGVLSCPAQMVIDDEIAGAVQRLRRGFAVDDETLAVELTRAVMDGDRNYLAQRHTVQHMRGGEVWMGNLAVVEGTWYAWREAGRPTATENAHERAQHLLSTHRVPPLAEDQDRALKQVIMSVN